MNPEAQAEFDRILAIEPAALTDADREFLQARRSYLTEEQKSVYGITDKAPVAPVEEAEEAPVDAPKKSKK